MHKRKHCHHKKRHYKHLLAALAGAAILSAAVAPAVPAMHQETSPNANNEPVATQEVTPPPPVADPSAAPADLSDKQELNVTATAYAPGPHDNDQWGDKTHLGTKVRPGVIAVDPRIIPLGSQVLIKYPDGHTEYAVAEDTGGAIKGHRIDVAKWTVREAHKFGIKPVKLYVLKRGTVSSA